MSDGVRILASWSGSGPSSGRSTSSSASRDMAKARSGDRRSLFTTISAAAPAASAFSNFLRNEQPPRYMTTICVKAFAAFESASQPWRGDAVTKSASMPSSNSGCVAAGPNRATTPSALWMIALLPHSSRALSALLRLG